MYKPQSRDLEWALYKFSLIDLEACVLTSIFIAVQYVPRLQRLFFFGLRLRIVYICEERY